MQINNIEIQNWKGIEDISLKPEKINAILGSNGSGKSSLIEAVKCLVSGDTPANHMKAGASTTSIIGDIKDVGVIERTWRAGKPATTRLNGKTTTQKSIAQTLEALCGLSAKTTAMMSSTDILEGMFGDELVQYLLSFLKSDMDIEKLISIAGVIPEECEEEIRMFFPAAPAVISLEEIANAHASFKEARSTAMAQQKIESAKATYSGEPPKRSLKDVEMRLKEIITQRATVMARRKEYANARKTKDERDRQIADMERRIASITATRPNPADLKNIKNLMEEKQKYISELTASITSMQTTKKTLLGVLNDLEAPVCPISKKLICTTDKSPLRDELSAEVDRLSAEISAFSDKKNIAANELRDLTNQSTALNKAASDYTVKVNLEEALNKLRSITITIPAAPSSEELEALDNEAAALEAEKKKILLYEASQKAAKNAERLEKAISIYKKLVELFAPTGVIRQKTLMHSIAPLETYCNDRMAKILPKYAIVFNGDGKMGFTFRTADGEDVPYKNLSNGERIRVLYILMDMLNALNGFHIMILDNLDGLDKTSLSEMCKLIKENSDDYDHIFLSSVNTVEFEEVIKADLPTAEIIRM